MVTACECLVYTVELHTYTIIHTYILHTVMILYIHSVKNNIKHNLKIFSQDVESCSDDNIFWYTHYTLVLYFFIISYIIIKNYIIIISYIYY